MGFTDDLLVGLAQLIADEGLGTWRPTGAYGDADPWPVFLQSTPGTPDLLRRLSAYDVDNDPDAADSVIGVQVRTRGDGDPSTVSDADDALFDAWHGRAHVTLSTGVHVVLITRQSATPNGTDSNRRVESLQNYYVFVHRPTPNRL